jgi:hypothetical protein
MLTLARIAGSFHRGQHFNTSRAAKRSPSSHHDAHHVTCSTCRCYTGPSWRHRLPARRGCPLLAQAVGYGLAQAVGYGLTQALGYTLAQAADRRAPLGCAGRPRRHHVLRARTGPRWLQLRACLALRCHAHPCQLPGLHATGACLAARLWPVHLVMADRHDTSP